MIRSNLEQFDGSADFVVQIVKRQLHAFRGSRGAGGVNNDCRIVPLPLGEGGTTASGLKRGLSAPNSGRSGAFTGPVSGRADTAACARRRVEIAAGWVTWWLPLFPVP